MSIKQLLYHWKEINCPRPNCASTHIHVKPILFQEMNRQAKKKIKCFT